MRLYKSVCLIVASLTGISGLLFYAYGKTEITYVSLQTLDDFRDYAATYPEYPPFRGDDLIDPDYSPFYESTTPWFSWSPTQLFKNKNRVWDPAGFKALLNEVTQDRKEKKLTGGFIANLKLDQAAQIYLLGRVHGGLHSVVRSLDYLQSQGILSHDLKMIAPHTYLIVTGDAIDQGPYSIEVVELLLNLVKNNPESVFYLRGKEESVGYWTDYNAGHELRIRAKNYLTEKDSLEDQMNDFFNTLPYTVYINEVKSPETLVQIGPWPISKLKVYIDQSGDFFEKSPVGVSYYNLSLSSKRTKATLPISIAASVQTEDIINHNHAVRGLGLLEPEYGAMIWSIISTPTYTHKKLYNFLYDAIVALRMEVPLRKSTIASYYRAADSDQSFVQDQSYFLLSGTPIKDAGYDPSQDIVLASSLSLEKGIPFIGKAVRRGMVAAISRTNREGGVNGRMIHLVVKNDNYSPDMARGNFKEFIKQEIDKVLLPIGSANLLANLDLVSKNQLGIFFPVTGAPDFRKKELEGVIHWTVTDGGQVKTLMETLIKENNARRFAFFYQDDAFGKGPLQTAHEVLKNNKIETFLDVPYARGSGNLKPQAESIKKFQPDAIGLFSVAYATQELIRQIGIDRLIGTTLFGISVIAEVSFKRFIKEHGLTLLAGSRVPNPAVSGLEIVKQYRQEMDALHYPYDTYSLEGYIATAILIEGLKRISGPINEDALMKSLESFNHFDLGGIVLTFDPDRRELGKYVWLQQDDDKDWQLLSSDAQ